MTYRRYEWSPRRGGKQKAIDAAVRAGATLVKPTSPEEWLKLKGRISPNLWLAWALRDELEAEK